MTMNRGQSTVKKMGGWARRMLQGAVVVAVAASVPSAWSAGGVQINNVAHGVAAMSQAGNVTTIRTGSQNTVINFQRLSVGAGETLQFLQPNSTSRVLNRIQGPEPTAIDGTLLSNGRVYIVNPAGVIFGNGAVVNVGGLYAAAGHISDANFMAGINQFTGNSGAVQNYGVIQASEIHLVGASVANFGQILASADGGGIVTMTSGKDVYIGESESPTGKTSVMVKVSSDASATKDGTGVSNSGKVDAGAGAIYMGAGDLYAAGIYNNGSLKASQISLSSHANTNVNEGTIDASNAHGKGGDIEMTGDKVGVFKGTVDASGDTGGGTIKIGGDFHGASGTQAASVTIVGPDAKITANGGSSGDGGSVAVWSNETTLFYGEVDARGGIFGGNGGFVEVSGKQNLGFFGMVNVGADHGTLGAILLDPSDITIQ
ncbi:MAG TPA: filamentous hemagglutinin N-terminal domain-containing protein, partial [Phycisphaerae bacterium]